MATVKEIEGAILTLSAAKKYDQVLILANELDRLKEQGKPSESSQSQINLDEVFTKAPQYPSDFITQSILKGGSSALRGLASLPFELAGKDELAKDVREVIPEFTGGRAGTDVGGTVVQYLAPGMAGYRAGSAAAKAISQSKLGKYIGGLLGAGAADAAVTVPEDASTIGNIIGYGPTQVTPETSPLERRAKVGAETLVLGPAVDAALAVPRAVGSAISKAGGGNALAREFQRQVSDKAAAEKNLFDFLASQNIQPAESLEQLARQRGLGRSQNISGYSPTVAEIAQDRGISALQKTVDRSGSMIERKQKNLDILSEEAKAFSDTSGDVFEAARQVSKYVDDTTEKALQRAKQSEESLVSAEDSLTGEIAAIAGASPRSVQETASENLASAINRENLRLSSEVDRLYKSIDPDGSLKIDITPLSRVADDIRKATSELSGSRKEETLKYGKSIFKDIDDSIDVQKAKNKQQTYRDLIGLRGRVNAQIGNAFKDNAQDAVKDLTRIRETIDKYTEQLENFANKKVTKQTGEKAPTTFSQFFDDIPADAARAAKEANDFYKNVYVPKFKQSLGRDFVKKSKSGDLYETKTGGMFLLGPTEGARQLSRIISDSPDREFAEKAVRDFMVSQLAQVVVDKSGKVIPKTARQFSRKYAPILDNFPDVKKEVDSLAENFATKSYKVGTLQNEVKKAHEALNLSQKEKTTAPIKFFLDDVFDNVEPDVVMQRIFSSERPDAAIKDLLSRFEGNNQFKESLKANVRDYIVSVIKNPATGDTVSVERIMKVVDSPKTARALDAIFSPSEIAKLNAVKNKLKQLNKVEAEKTLPKGTLRTKSAAESARLILASLYGIIKGRAIFTISRMISDKFRNLTAEQAAEEILSRAMLDPELALLLLKRDTEKTRGLLSGYIANNIVGDEPEEE